VGLVRRVQHDQLGVPSRLAPLPLPNLTPAQLLNGAREVAERFPAAELVKNQVGNLAIMIDGEYAGYLDLRTGEVDAG
jgi:hypothetical protein